MDASRSSDPSPQSSGHTVDTAESTTSPAPRPARRAPIRVTAGPLLEGDSEDDGDDIPRTPACIAALIDYGSVESHRLFLARRTALEMLRDRGYSVAEFELARTLPEFRAWSIDGSDLERLSITTTLATDPSNKVKVIFCPPEPVKKATMKEIYNKTKEENLSRLILVLQGKITSQATESIKDIFTFKVDIFQITELLCNITKHVLKPKHEILTEEEKSKLLKEHNVKDTQLPRMLESDAIARYYGLGKGTVIKVTYDSELTGKHVTYRCIF